MRKIKFRAYHKVKNRMFKVFSFCNEFIKVVTDISLVEKFRIDEFENIQQFTGLLDKNGLEIYEGDIVNSGTGEILWCELECMFKVKWHGEIYKRVRGKNDRYTLNGEPLFMNAHIVWEVIGNIHENPELLK